MKAAPSPDGAAFVYHGRMARLGRLLGALGLLAGAACAEGSSITDFGAGGSGGGGVGLGGRGGAGGDEGPSTTTSSRSSAASGPGSSASSGGGGEGGEGGAGTSSTSSTTSSTGTGQGCNFASPNQCTSAEALGFLPGDEDSAPLSVQGATSKWFSVRITEESSSISETDLSYRVALASPAGMNYDLFVHPGPQDGDQDCGAAPIQGQSDGSAEVVFQEWDDDQGFGGEDDSVWLMIEVRYVAGESCSLSDQWTLTIEGYI